MHGFYSRAELETIATQILGERLPGRPKQDVYEASAVQNYKLGSRRVMGAMGNAFDHRAWRYTKLATTTRTDGYAAYSGGLGLFAKAVALSITPTTGKAQLGERTLTTTTTMVVNAYAGGLLTMFEAGQPICMRGIISNTATVITLDAPLPGTYTAAATAQVIPAPYNEVIIPGVSCSANCYDPCVGVLNSPLDGAGNVVAAGDFVWIQTWGFCNMWAYGTYEGANTAEREVIMTGTGAAQILTPANLATYASYQRIGFVYPSLGNVAQPVAEHPNADDGVDTTLMNHIVFLQIAP